MATKTPSKEGKLKKLLKAPIRVLSKAKDFYLTGMTELSDQVGYGTVMGCPTGQLYNYNLPRSFSVNSTKSSNYDDDYRELLRVASSKTLSKKIELDFLRRQQSQKSPNSSGPNANMSRSYSVGIGRIDEEKPCDFGEDVKVNTDVFTRSRSYTVTRRNTGEA